MQEIVTAMLYMDGEKNSNNNRQYIDISGLAQELGDETCNARPGIHAFSGGHFTASFYWKGKQRAYEIAHRKKRRTVFGQLGDIA